MSITINGSGNISGLSSGGLPANTVTPSLLSSGAPSWDANGNLTTAGTLVGSSAMTMRNRIINGGMDVWQRGTSFTSPNGYTSDRWGIGYTGSSIASAARVTGPTGYNYALQLTGETGNTLTALYQKIESANSADLVGKTVTISATIYASSAQIVTWYLLYPTAVDNFNSQTGILQGTWNIGTSPQTFTATVSNLPSGVANGLQLNIYPQNAGPFTSGTFTITGVQLEPGSVSTPFERRPYGHELMLCQRYYEVGNFNSQIYGTSGWGYTEWIGFLANKRVTPTMTIIPSGASNYTTSGTALVNLNGFDINKQVTTTGNGGALISWTASAEL